MDLYLLPFDGNEEPIKLGDITTFGRLSDNTVVLPDAEERHARIERKNETFVIRDLRSQEGTFVNQTRIYEAAVRPGDHIRIGTFEYRVENENVFKDTIVLASKYEKWNEQLSRIPFFAKTDLPVLLLGASGTGKEVLAANIHGNSYRRSGPFVTVNCSALSENLVESELFGHVRGSFTGSTQDRKGAFEAARGGTLFLDEIGDLPLTLQPKLLRALENKEIRPVGSDKNVKTNVRVIAATHQNLKKLVADGLFRKDLFYRLNVIQLNIPRLKERIVDFEALLFTFAKEFRVRFSEEAISALKNHSWPGNIRELRNLVSRTSAIFPNEHIHADHLNHIIEPVSIEEAMEAKEDVPHLKEIEREIILQRLIANHGNQRRTAIELGIAKSTLNDKIKFYKINIPDLLKPRKTI